VAVAHHQYGADLAFRQNLDRSRELRLRLDALDLMAFGIENCTYRHGRLPEADRALESERGLWFLEFAINSLAPISFRAHLASTDI
jgi:hypothetical protein